MNAQEHVRRRVVVVGAGLSGLACARTLVDDGWTVTVVDKGRRPGGRATSRHDDDGTFDHGAQFFTARGAWLQQRLGSWEAGGVVAQWAPRLAQTGGARPRQPSTWWVVTPSMGALAAHLANGLDVAQGVTVTSLSRADDGVWSISATGPDGGALAPLVADAVVVTVPAAQASRLLGAAHSALTREIARVTQTPCWAVMLTARGVGDLGADVFEDGEGPIAWAAREASKPGREGSRRDFDAAGGEERWLLHASAACSEAHLEDEPDVVARALTDAFFRQHQRAERAEIVRVRAHRWRYAQGHMQQPRGALYDASARLAVCGDWVNGSRVEGALTSGVAAAERLMRVGNEDADT